MLFGIMSVYLSAFFGLAMLSSMVFHVGLNKLSSWLIIIFSIVLATLFTIEWRKPSKRSHFFSGIRTSILSSTPAITTRRRQAL